MRALLRTNLRPNEEVIRLTVKVYQTKIKVAAIVTDGKLAADVEGWYMIETEGKVTERRIWAHLIKSENGLYFDFDRSTDVTMKTKEDFVKYALAKELASTNVCGGTNVNQSTLNNFFNEMKKHTKKEATTKVKVLYTIAPYNDFWMGVFDRVKEFKSKKAAFKYADELIKSGCKKVNINTDYFLSADMLRYEMGVYDGKKVEIYESFG